MNKKEFSIVYQILQDCLFSCNICNRRYVKSESSLSFGQRKQMVDILSSNGAKRITITGGEPMLIKDEVTELLKYIHDNKIHTCLSSTGFSFTRQYLQLLNGFLDHLLISVPTLDTKEWQHFFGAKDKSMMLYNNVIEILNNCQDTGIILEVCTVAQRNNINKIEELGNMLSAINRDIIWRIEYYYPMGINAHLKTLFEVSQKEIEDLHSIIKNKFRNVFKDIYLSMPTRNNARDLLITPNGDLVNTSNNVYSSRLQNVFDPNLELNFKMRRNWRDYKKYLRDWSI